MTMRKALARAPGAYGRATGPRTGPAPVLVIDDVPAGVTTTLGRRTAAGEPTATEAGGNAVLHTPGSAGALIRKVRWLEGTDPTEPWSGIGDDRSRP
jgi:hypothetical protein